MTSLLGRCQEPTKCACNMKQHDGLDAFAQLQPVCEVFGYNSTYVSISWQEWWVQLECPHKTIRHRFEIHAECRCSFWTIHMTTYPSKAKQRMPEHLDAVNVTSPERAFIVICQDRCCWQSHFLVQMLQLWLRIFSRSWFPCNRIKLKQLLILCLQSEAHTSLHTKAQHSTHQQTHCYLSVCILFEGVKNAGWLKWWTEATVAVKATGPLHFHLFLSEHFLRSTTPTPCVSDLLSG